VTLLYWVLASAVALVVTDRLALWAESRGWVYWRRTKPEPSGGSGALGELIELFQPSRRHVVEERQRQHLTADLPESGAPPLGVDLEAGVVRLTERR
jgi:hypothetical protein